MYFHISIMWLMHVEMQNCHVIASNMKDVYLLNEIFQFILLIILEYTKL